MARPSHGSQLSDYGSEIILTLSHESTVAFGRGYDYPAQIQMVKFVEVFQDVQVIATLPRTLSWVHFCELLLPAKLLQRGFYEELCQLHAPSPIPSAQC